MISVIPPKTMIRNLTILFILLIFAGCEIINDLHPTALFEIQYINHAWGYQHSGSIIDASGDVREFDLPSVWNYPDSEGYISKACLLYTSPSPRDGLLSRMPSSA